MMRLVRIEWRRMWARRMPWVLVIVVGSAMLFAGATTFFTHSPEPPSTHDMEEQIARDVEQCRIWSMDEWNRVNDGTTLETDPDYLEYISQFPSAEAYADDACNPDYFGYWVQDPRFCLVSLYEPDVMYRNGCPDLEDVEQSEWVPSTIRANGVDYPTARPMAAGIIPVTSLMLLAVAAVIGASFIGAEYGAGTIETTLLWEPRRRRVLSAKLAVAGVTAFLIHIFLLALLVLAMLPAAQWRGSTAGVDSDFWFGLVGVILRGGLIAAGFCMIALAISTMTRGTIGGVVALIGYIAISPSLTFTLLRGLRRFDLTENMAAFANGGEVGKFIRTDEGYLESVFSHGSLTALAIVCVYVAIAIALAMVVFNRRDID